MSRKMKRRSMGTTVLVAIALVALGSQWVQAQEIKINTRPLTPQEIKDYGLTNTTQTANGTHVVGLGQPVYLELLVEPGTVVTQVVWTLDAVIDEDGDPLASTAAITESPLGLEIPTFDFGYWEEYGRDPLDVIDRALIVPDLKGTYQISVAASTSNDVLNASLDVVGSVFVGKDHYLCVLCHSGKMPDFNATDHANAFRNQITGAGSDHFQSFCIKCHVVGYDSAPAAVNGGFDDVATDTGWTFPETLTTNNWDDMPAELQNVSNIQCENCHGPADEHIQSLGDIDKIAISLSAGNCGQCHDALTHHYKVEEWENTMHATGYVFRASGSCAPCHSTKGFIDANDPGMNELDEIIATKGTGAEGIACAACHDPHAPGAGAHQLRVIESVTLGNGEVITQGGDGLICMACHHDRYDAELMNSSRGPHHGTQTDLLFGKNAIEYGQDMPSSKHWDVVENTCTQCHMQDAHGTVPEYAEHKVGGHSFGLAYDDGTNAPVYLTATCVSCHGEIEDFNFGGEDYDLDGIVEGVQQEVADMMADLAMLLPPFGETTVDDYRDMPSDDKLKKAAWNYYMILDDGSHGVHNPKYISALLRSSIADLKGGIDIDCDGLVDSWEIEHFGDLTSQSGSDDYDEDGLTNAQEENLGTDPTLADSDGDTYSDYIEIMGGSDPLEITSEPSGDMVILPAAEVGYLPQGTNTTIQFQANDALGGEGWQNIGPVQTNAGDWLFHLESVRGTTNRFYRAIEE